MTIARASSRPLAEKLELGADVRTAPQLVHTRLASLLAGHGVVCDRIDITEDRVIFAVPELNAATGALVLAEFAEVTDLYQLSGVELRVVDHTPLHGRSRSWQNCGVSDVTRASRSCLHMRSGP